MPNAPTILYEDNHLLAICKPFGMLSQGDDTGDLSAGDWVEDYIRTKYNKPGNVYVGLLHRLDRPVGGVMLFAKTSKAAARMTAAFKDRKIQKIYHAVSMRRPEAAHGNLQHFIGQLPGKNIVRVYPKAGDGRKKAELDYRVLAEKKGRCLMEVRPKTGRKHQIRVQLASIRCPLLGDLKYGAPKNLADKSIGLFAKALVFTHPTRKEETIRIEAPHPQNWPWTDWK